MNGVHDLGGMHGFGPVRREKAEPVFHHQWEKQVFGMSISAMVPTGSSGLDGTRHRIERMDPAQYLSTSYYEHWLAGLETALIDSGLATREDIEARVQKIMADPQTPLPRREDPAYTAQVVQRLRTGASTQRPTKARPRFKIGDRVLTRNLNPPGHTRLPRYARGKAGMIERFYGAHVFPDANAAGKGENPQPLYGVRFNAGQLWGDSAEPNQSVSLDLWESYLKPVPAPKIRRRALAKRKRNRK